MSLKVLLVYPNFKGMNMLPPGVALLSAVLKERGFSVRLFDTTSYRHVEGMEADSDQSKSERLMARPFKYPKKVELTLKDNDCFDDFEDEVLSFQPDLLALSVTEDTFPLGLRLLHRVHHLKILTIAGGVFPTFAPELVLSYPEVDIVCKGEGEDALRALCERLEKGQRYDDINNLWVKKQDGRIRSNPTRMVDMDQNPLIDMTIFEEARFYRPMGGKVWRMFPVETHRGCPYKCAFCNSPSQERLYKEEQGKAYLRRKSFQSMHKELLFYKNEMKADFFYFWADTFFSWKKGEFEEFCEMYQDINLPFWCQTRIETVTAERLKTLKEIGCARMAFGIEHGNETFRRQWIQRPISNDLMIKNFKIVKASGIPFSVNNILGFPHETYELAFDTVLLNRHVDADDRNAYQFTPFHGTPLREECERLGLIRPEDITPSFVVGDSLLNMPQFPKERVEGLVKTFNMYVKFPEARWPDIQKAEKDTSEGRRIYQELREEFVDRFFNKESVNFEAAAMEKEFVAPANP